VAAEPLLYADLCLRQPAPVNGRIPNAATEKGRYHALLRAFAAKPSRRSLVRSVERSELGLNAEFIKQLTLYPNLRALGTVHWPLMHGPKNDLVLATKDDWDFTRYCLHKYRAREWASIGTWTGRSRSSCTRCADADGNPAPSYARPRKSASRT
jgi:hypothetical protein